MATHSRMLLSGDLALLVSVFPSGLNATLLTTPVCPSRTMEEKSSAKVVDRNRLETKSRVKMENSEVFIRFLAPLRLVDCERASRSSLFLLSSQGPISQ